MPEIPFPFSPLVDLRPRAAPAPVQAIFKNNVKLAAQDELLRAIALKDVRPLCRIALHAAMLGSVDVPKEESDLRDFAVSCQECLVLFVQYSFLMHSDIVSRRKHLSFAALGLSEAESSRQASLFDAEDVALIEQVVKKRAELATLQQGLAPKKPKKPWNKRKPLRFRGKDDKDRSPNEKARPPPRDDTKADESGATSGSKSPYKRSGSTPTKGKGGGKKR